MKGKSEKAETVSHHANPKSRKNRKSTVKDSQNRMPKSKIKKQSITTSTNNYKTSNLSHHVVVVASASSTTL